MSLRPVEIIVAVDEDAGFAKKGKIPWHSKKDFAHFVNTTNGQACIMGRRTYEEMYELQGGDNTDFTNGILKGRDSYVLTSNLNFKAPGATVTNCLEAAIDAIEVNKTIFILGGEQLFIEAFSRTEYVHMTIIPGRYDCDQFFQIRILNKHFDIVDGEQSDNLKFIKYKRK